MTPTPIGAIIKGSKRSVFNKIKIKNKIRKKINPSLIGFLQAIGVIVYCILIAILFNFLGKAALQPPGILGFAAILVILVFSAAVTGSIVFGYPAYLFFKEKKVKEPLLILAFTSLYCLIILAITAVIYFAINLLK